MLMITRSSAVARITGMSRFSTAPRRYVPRPGSEKICSMMTAPARMPPICRPSTVTAGMADVFSAWPATTCRVLPPLAHPVRTNAEFIVSERPARSCRDRTAKVVSARAVAGRMRCRNHSTGLSPNGTNPNGGSQRSCTANTVTNSSATQNDGIAMARLVPTRRPRSKIPLGRRPPRTPKSRASGIANRRVMSARLNVTGRRSAISSVIGFSLYSEVPRSPWTTLASQSPYRTKNGRSSSSSWRTSSMAPGGASGPPASVWAASPGMSAVRLNSGTRRSGARAEE